MKLENAFAAAHEHDVEVYHDEMGEVGRGKLTFGDGEWAHLNFGHPSSSGKLVEGVTYPRLIARTVSGDVFTLFGFEFHGFYAFVDFMVEGDVGDAFRSIRVRYSDVSEWFLARQYLKGEVGEGIAWENKPAPIDVDIRTGGEHFSLSTSVVSSFSHVGEDQVIHEHVVFAFEKGDSLFDVGNVREKCRELSNFITVLIAQPIDIVSVGLVSEDGRLHYAYFPHFKRKSPEVRKSSWTRFLVQKEALDGRWQTIFENYYRSDFRRVTWARMAGMLRYDSYWEYRVVGYISLLDGVVKKKASGQQMEISRVPHRIKALEHKLDRMLEPLSSTQKENLLEMFTEDFSSRGRSFSACYRYAVAGSDARVMSAINFSESDFDLIKKLRNEIAHGDEISLPKTNLTRVSMTVNKVTLLLTYWAFADFGLTADDFLQCLYHSHNPLALTSDLDKVHLSRVLGKADFHAVSEERFNEIASIKGVRVDSCFVRDQAGQLQFSERYTLMLKDWMTQRKSGVMKPQEIFGIEPDKVKFSATAYLECADKHLELFHIYVMNVNELPED